MRLMNKSKIMVTMLGLFAGITLIGSTALALQPGSIKYTGPDTVGPNYAAFNIFYDVPSVGNEADFIRVKKDGEPNSSLTNSYNTTCKTGDKFDVWFYVHNGANPSSNNNGTGPGVAKDVVAKINLPQGEQTSFNINGGVTSSNASAINDGATINCGGKKFKITYVSGSGSAFLDLPNKVVPLPDNIASTGASIGTNSLDGSVWGCWEQRVWMGMKVVVTEVVEPPKPQTLTCDAVFNRKNLAVDVKINGVATNGATVVGYMTVWGDNTPDATTQSASHTFSKYDTKYTIKSYVKGNVDGKETDWITSDKCTYSFSEPKPDKPIEVCDLNSKKIITIKESEFDSSKHSKNLEDCATPPKPGQITVCEISTKKIININEDDFDAQKHTKDLAKCTVTPPVTPPTTPTPETLPNTGAEGVVGLMAGVSILGAIGHRMWTIKKMQ